MADKDSKQKLSKEELKAKKLADAEAKKQEKARKAEELRAKKQEKANKTKRKASKDDVKMQQEKSQLAKDLGIRISNPYGYYPDDVDPIIKKLQDELNLLTKENKQMRDQIGDLQHKNNSLSTELTSLKLQISMTEFPVSLEDNLAGFGQLGNINGRDYDDDSIDLSKRLLDGTDDPVEEKPKKIKLNIGGNR